jgi:hypothetical protein
MKKYLKSILLFDLAIPALALGIPGIGLFVALASFDSYADEKKAEFEQHVEQARQIAQLRHQLEPIQDQLPTLKAMLSSRDIEARLDRGISSALQKLSPSEIESTLRDVQPGPFAVPQTLGDGKHLALRFYSRWEPLTLAALSWETQQPNLLLESLTLQKADQRGQQSSSQPYLQSELSYFVIAEN